MASLLNPTAWFASRKKRSEINLERKDNPEQQQRDTAVGYSAIDWLYGGFEQMVNPDNLVRVKGAQVYHKMLFDDQVSAAFNLKLNLIISRNFRFEPTGSGQDEIVDFFNRCVSDLISGTWLAAMRSILMAKAYGFSVNEKVFRSEMVDGKLRWVLDRLNPKPFDTILFSSDEYGNRTALHQVVDGATSRQKKLDLDKFIIHINKPEVDSIWGQSDLKSAYKPYWRKDITGRFWDIYMERVAGGFPVITPNERAGNLVGNSRADLEKTVKNVTGLSGIVLPQGFDAAVIQAEETEAFEKKSTYHDKQIARAILIPNLLGFSEQGKVGSYSQSQTQFEIMMMLIKEDGDYLADDCNEQLFSQLAWWNFGVKDYPRMVFDPYTNEQKRLIAETWSKAVKDGAVINTLDDEMKTREYLLYPNKDREAIGLQREKKKEEVAKEKEQQVVIDDKKAEGSQDAREADKKPDMSSVQNIESSENERVPAAIPEGRQTRVFADKEQTDIPVPNSDASITFIDRVAFPVVEEQLDTIEEDFLDGMSVGVETIEDELIAGIKSVKKDLPKNKNDIKFNELRTKLNKSISTKSKSVLKQSIFNSLRTTYNTGWNNAHKATVKAANDADAPRKFLKRINSVVLLSERKMCVEEEWAVFNFAEGLALESADAWFSSKSFKITGDLTETMLSNAVEIMTNGIVNDWSTSDMVDEFVRMNINITGGTEKQERARLNTIVRTNMSTIFTQAHLAFYNDPALQGFVEAMEYSAILDRVTTQVCRRLDQSVYPMNARVWSYITPPNHHNCRSVLIPVTVLDTWKRDMDGFTEKQLPSPGFGRTGLAKLYKIDLGT